MLYYEDDGTTYNYENGASYERTISFDPMKSELTLSDKNGDFAGRFRKVCLILHGFDAISSVRNGVTDLKISENKKTQSVAFDLNNTAISLKWKYQKKK